MRPAENHMPQNHSATVGRNRTADGLAQLR